ncbi:MAG: metallophosphoesterase [Nitrosopumilaceae archaeon]
MHTAEELEIKMIRVSDIKMDLIFSDIHADFAALDKILKIATSQKFKVRYGEPDRIINLGDVLERGTHPKEVLSTLRSLENNYVVVSVMGNHDEAFLYNRPVSGSSVESLQAHANLTTEDLLFFSKNKDGTFGQQRFIDKKNNLFYVHGGPIEPKTIIPKGVSPMEEWLYQNSWQRISEEEFEYFSYYGYHYLPSSAFRESKNHFKNSVILCGHQHTERIIERDANDNIKEILSSLNVTTEKISDFFVQKKEIEILESSNYLIRLGMAGPEGYYGLGSPYARFGIVQHDQKKVILFEVK